MLGKWEGTVLDIMERGIENIKKKKHFDIGNRYLEKNYI